MRITVIGAGYVGLVTAACLADLGNDVICIDIDKDKISKLNRGMVPIYEPGLEDLLKRNREEKRIAFSTNLKAAVRKSGIIFIAVGTPPKENGEADLTHVEAVAEDIARYMTSYHLVVEKSTTPVETGKWIKRILEANAHKGVKFDVASNPEFLREGKLLGQKIGIHEIDNPYTQLEVREAEDFELAGPLIEKWFK